MDTKKEAQRLLEEQDFEGLARLMFWAGVREHTHRFAGCVLRLSIEPHAQSTGRGGLHGSKGKLGW